jgi:hypothetical protein
MENNILELQPEQQLIVKKAEDISTKLSTFKITTQEEYNISGEHLKSIKSAYKQIEDLRLSMTRPLDDSKARIMDFFRIPLNVLTNAEGVLKKGILMYQRAQEAIRIEQEKKLQAEAEKKRQEALEKAEKARAEGKDAKAEKYEDKANNIIAPTLAPTIQKVSGVSTKMIWKFEVIDETLIPREYLTPDLVKIGKVVRATGNTLPIPGIRIFPEETISAGGR